MSEQTGVTPECCDSCRSSAFREVDVFVRFDSAWWLAVKVDGQKRIMVRIGYCPFCGAQLPEVAR